MLNCVSLHRILCNWSVIKWDHIYLEIVTVYCLNFCKLANIILGHGKISMLYMKRKYLYVVIIKNVFVVWSVTVGFHVFRVATFQFSLCCDSPLIHQMPSNFQFFLHHLTAPPNYTSDLTSFICMQLPGPPQPPAHITVLPQWILNQSIPTNTVSIHSSCFVCLCFSFLLPRPPCLVVLRILYVMS